MMRMIPKLLVLIPILVTFTVLASGIHYPFSKHSLLVSSCSSEATDEEYHEAVSQSPPNFGGQHNPLFHSCISINRQSELENDSVKESKMIVTPEHISKESNDKYREDIKGESNIDIDNEKLKNEKVDIISNGECQCSLTFKCCDKQLKEFERCSTPITNSMHKTQSEGCNLSEKLNNLAEDEIAHSLDLKGENMKVLDKIQRSILISESLNDNPISITDNSINDSCSFNENLSAQNSRKVKFKFEGSSELGKSINSQDTTEGSNYCYPSVSKLTYLSVHKNLLSPEGIEKHQNDVKLNESSQIRLNKVKNQLNLQALTNEKPETNELNSPDMPFTSTSKDEPSIKDSEAQTDLKLEHILPEPNNISIENKKNTDVPIVIKLEGKNGSSIDMFRMGNLLKILKAKIKRKENEEKIESLEHGNFNSASQGLIDSESSSTVNDSHNKNENQSGNKFSKTNESQVSKLLTINENVHISEQLPIKAPLAGESKELEDIETKELASKLENSKLMYNRIKNMSKQLKKKAPSLDVNPANAKQIQGNKNLQSSQINQSKLSNINYLNNSEASDDSKKYPFLSTIKSSEDSDEIVALPNFNYKDNKSSNEKAKDSISKLKNESLTTISTGTFEYMIDSGLNSDEEFNNSQLNKETFQPVIIISKEYPTEGNFFKRAKESLAKIFIPKKQENSKKLNSTKKRGIRDFFKKNKKTAKDSNQDNNSFY